MSKAIHPLGDPMRSIPPALIRILAPTILLVTAFACGKGPGEAGYTSGVPWSYPRNLASWKTTDALDPVVAVDHTGDVLVAWHGRVDSSSHSGIWACRYSSTEYWSEPAALSSTSSDAVDQRIAVNNDGLATLVWVQATSPSSIQSYHCSPLDGFTSLPDPVSLGTGDVMTPSVAMDLYGDAIAAWLQSDGSHYHVWVCRYTPISGWGSRIQLDSNLTEEARNPVVAMDPSGNAVVAWQQSTNLDLGPYSVKACLYGVGSGWSDVQDLHPGFDARNPAVAMSSAGARVFWDSASDATSHVQICTRGYTKSQGWSDAHPLSGPTVNSHFAAAAMDAAGNCIVTWGQAVRDASYAVMATRYSTSSGWATPASFEHGLSHTSLPVISMNPSGTAAIAWSQLDESSSNIYAVRYRNDWEHTFQINLEGSGRAYVPTVSVGASGEIWATWNQPCVDTRYYDVMASALP